MVNDSLTGQAIIDAHHHLWDLDALYYPWLTDRISERVCGEYAAIRRNYLPADFLRDVGDLHLIGSVHVEAVIDRPLCVDETTWLQGLHDRNGLPTGIVAYADLAADDAEAVLAQHCRCGAVRGIRQMLHEAYIDPNNPGTSPLSSDRWRRGLKHLKKFDLSFDLQVYFQQFAEAEDVIADNPDQQFVLCHTGLPALRDDDSLAAWRAGIRSLSRHGNLAVKLSGFGMFDRHWTVENIAPFVHHVIDSFGTERCMFASNFPVDSLARSYQTLWQAYNDVVSTYSVDERDALFWKNAARIYRLNVSR